MRVLALLLCGLAVALATQEEWEAWKAEYGRDYSDVSPEEEAYRYSVFESNMDFINAHNAQFDNVNVLFTVGMNQFGDMTTEEIQSLILGWVPEDVPFENPTKVFTTSEDDPPLPAAIDWRIKANGSVTAVKDQKICGSCWAFSATGSLEGQHFLKTNKTVSLSEQNVVDCDKKDHGCHGGTMEGAFNFIKSEKGIDTEASYPYTARDGTCKFNATNVGATVTGFVDIAHGDEAALQKAVATVGPISVAIDAHLPSFHFYKKGIYHDKECSSVHLDHGVLAVGYNSTAPSEENGHKAHDFWIVKNSWNAKWGDHGYIHMIRNKKNACGIATDASYPLV